MKGPCVVPDPALSTKLRTKHAALFCSHYSLHSEHGKHPLRGGNQYSNSVTGPRLLRQSGGGQSSYSGGLTPRATTAIPKELVTQVDTGVSQPRKSTDKTQTTTSPGPTGRKSGTG